MLSDFVPSQFKSSSRSLWRNLDIRVDDTALYIGDFTVTYRSELVLQQALVDRTAPHHCTVLEIGYGLGMANRAIREKAPEAHIVIEAHPQVFEMIPPDFKHAHNSLIFYGLWQEILSFLRAETYDAIIFDPYPFEQPKFDGTAHATWMMVEPFLEQAERLLKDGAKFGYIDFSNSPNWHGKQFANSRSSFSILETAQVQVELPASCLYSGEQYATVIVATKRSG